MNDDLADVFDRLFGRPPAPAELSVADLQRILRGALDIEGMLPFTRPLTVKEKKLLGSILFSTDGLFVHEIVKALHRADLFAHLKVDPRSMEEGVRRARLWVSIGIVGRMMTQMADEQYLLEMSTLVNQGMRVIRQTRAEAAMEYRPPGTDDRVDALKRAEHVLYRRGRRRNPRRR